MDITQEILKSPRLLLPDPPTPFSGNTILSRVYPGVKKNKDKWACVIYAWRIPGGFWIKHSEPEIIAIDKQTSSISTNVEHTTITFSPTGTYTDNDTNYQDNIDLFDDYQFNYSGAYEEITMEMGVFMTVIKDTVKEALLEGTYYLLGTFREGDSFTWSDNEESIPTGEVLNVDTYSHHMLSSKRISRYKGAMSLIQTITNFTLPGWNWAYGNTGVIRSGDSGTLQEAAVKVKIVTDEGIFYRMNTIWFEEGAGTNKSVLPYLLTYPDQQATEMTLYRKNDATYGGNNGLYYELAVVELRPHPWLNLAYDYDASRAEGTMPGGGGSEALDFSINNDVLVEEDEMKFTDITKLFCPLRLSYKLNDTVQNIVDNSNSPGDQRFGDYPVYVLGLNNIYACSESPGVLISRFNLLSDGLGVRTPNAFETHMNTLFFVSDQGIHYMDGVRVQDMFDLIEGAKTIYVESGGSLTSTEGYDQLFSAAQVYITSSKSTREILIGAEGGNSIFVFNTKHSSWYNHNIIASGAVVNTLKSVLRLNNDAYFFLDDELFKWGGAVNGSGDFSLVTNPFSINDYSMMKKIRRSVLEGYFDLGASSELKVFLQGKRSTHNDWVDIINYTENTAKTFNSFYLKSNYGSFQSFRVIIKGTGINTGTYIKNLLIGYDNRSQNFVK